MDYSKLQKLIKNNKLSGGLEAYRLLKKVILSGYLLPGERLIEKDLSDIMGISRIPIREALKKLESERLITIEINKGATVSKMSPQEIEEIYFIVGCLEGMAARFAVNNLGEDSIKKLGSLLEDMSEIKTKQDYKSWLKKNIDFHKVYIDASGKPQLANLILEKRAGLSRYWFLACSKPGLLEICIAQHSEIVEAFQQQNPERAQRNVEKHIMSVGTEIREYLEKLPIL